MRRRMGIGTRIAGGSFLIALVICAVAGLLIDLRVQGILRDSTEAVLASDAAPYSASLRQEPGEDLDPPGPSLLVAVLPPTGGPTIDTLPADVSAAVRARPTDSATEVVELGSPDMIVRIEPIRTDQGTFRVVTARPEADEGRTLTRMRLLLGVSLAVIALGVLVTALLLTTASLDPVRRIRRTAERLLEEPGEELLPVGPAEDEVARLARTLNELISSLRASARRERQLVSDASHELRTPLAILRARLELARTADTDVAAMREDVAGAERSARRLGDLVDSLLELSRIEASAPAAATPAQLVEEVRDAADRAELRAQGTAVQVRRVERLAPAPGVVSLPAHDLGRVVDNLVGNALRALDGQGVLTLGLTTVPGALELVVGDTGPGMPEDFVPHALERFRRADRARGGTDGGTGLGLAIVAAIVERAHGEIALENRPGHGLRVRITLPIVAAEDPAGS